MVIMHTSVRELQDGSGQERPAVEIPPTPLTFPVTDIVGAELRLHELEQRRSGTAPKETLRHEHLRQSKVAPRSIPEMGYDLLGKGRQH